MTLDQSIPGYLIKHFNVSNWLAPVAMMTFAQPFLAKTSRKTLAPCADAAWPMATASVDFWIFMGKGSPDTARIVTVGKCLSPSYSAGNLRLADQVQAAHRPGRRGELIRIDTHALEHGNEEVRQRVIVLGVEHMVLTMIKTSTH